jgi:hypothetical protein
MFNKIDKMWFGSLIGFIGPVFVLFIFYLINFKHISFYAFISKYMEYNALIPLFSLCAIVNLGIFFLFIHFEKYYAARGIIFSTLIYTIIVFAYKLS